MEKSIQVLQASPMFQMSLHSKELFHSNFLWWLGRQGSKFRDLFKNILITIGISEKEIKTWNDSFEVVREMKFGPNCKMDLVIKAPDTKFVCKNGKEGKKINKDKVYAVIENKVKSIPTNEQLKGYSAALLQKTSSETEVNKILLTIEPLELKKPLHPEWKQSTYKEVCNVLTNWKENRMINAVSDPLSYEEEIVADYTDMLKALINLSSLSKVTSKGAFPFSQKRSNGITCLRISDLIDKWNAAHLSVLVNRMLEEKKLENTVSKKKCCPGYTNGVPLIEVKIPNLSGNATGCIQIQGTQYRLCIEGVFPHNDQSKLADYLSNTYPGIIFRSRSEFRENKLKDCPNNRIIFDSKEVNGEKSKVLCVYGQDLRKSRFIYQYVVIKPLATVEDIINQIEKDIILFSKFSASEKRRVGAEEEMDNHKLKI